jgi:hypothetical protein
MSNRVPRIRYLRYSLQVRGRMNFHSPTWAVNPSVGATGSDGPSQEIEEPSEESNPSNPKSGSCSCMSFVRILGSYPGIASCPTVGKATIAFSYFLNRGIYTLTHSSNRYSHTRCQGTSIVGKNVLIVFILIQSVTLGPSFACSSG